MHNYCLDLHQEFLVPKTNGLTNILQKFRVSFGVKPKGQKLAVYVVFGPLSVDKRTLTFIFRITI